MLLWEEIFEIHTLLSVQIVHTIHERCDINDPWVGLRHSPSGGTMANAWTMKSRSHLPYCTHRHHNFPRDLDEISFHLAKQ